jgi:hypothetical protein
MPFYPSDCTISSQVKSRQLVRKYHFNMVKSFQPDIMIPRILSNTKNATSTVSSIVETDPKQERALVIMAKYLKSVNIFFDTDVFL